MNVPIAPIHNKIIDKIDNKSLLLLNPSPSNGCLLGRPTQQLQIIDLINPGVWFLGEGVIRSTTNRHGCLQWNPKNCYYFNHVHGSSINQGESLFLGFSKEDLSYFL